MTLNITQEEMVTLEDRPRHKWSEIPLQATITLNSPSFSSETLTAAANHALDCAGMCGDLFLLIFLLGLSSTSCLMEEQRTQA